MFMLYVRMGLGRYVDKSLYAFSMEQLTNAYDWSLSEKIVWKCFVKWKEWLLQKCG